MPKISNTSGKTSVNGDIRGFTLASGLKPILDERGLSIRQLAAAIDYRPESVRMLYNNDMERLPRDLIARVCVYLDIDISDLLHINEK